MSGSKGKAENQGRTSPSSASERVDRRGKGRASNERSEPARETPDRAPGRGDPRVSESEVRSPRRKTPLELAAEALGRAAAGLDAAKTMPSPVNAIPRPVDRVEDRTSANAEESGVPVLAETRPGTSARRDAEEAATSGGSRPARPRASADDHDTPERPDSGPRGLELAEPGERVETTPASESVSARDDGIRRRIPAFLGELDLYLTGEGNHHRLYEKLGAHPVTLDGVAGVAFAVWAPNATGVSVIGEFNQWDGRVNPMQPMGTSGVWYTFVPDLRKGSLYKYEIRTRDNNLRIKSDPFAFATEIRPHSASKVWDVDAYTWGDETWMHRRREKDWRLEPMSIYEVHLGSWMRVPEDGMRWLTYAELAPRLVDHCRRYGFNFVELLPIAEHLLDQSWGYQVTNYYAPTSRHGTPDEFKHLVDTLHQADIGVIIDWVPAHFPRDDSGLRWFDGTALYEHQDPRQGEHRDWGTLIFNYGRNEVRNFLLANALFWLDKYHVDGLRVDAVASMLYLDYSRQDGDWIPNKYGGRENLEAIDFLRRLNELVYGLHPGAFTVAEESTAWGGVTLPTYLGGLGFGFKWDMGWMHDTLQYFSKEPVHRSYHHNDLTFGMLYAWSETFVLPLSHDEVVHGKRSLLGRMPGDDWQRFANLRALYGFMFTRPGKKLLFMGAEFAQSWEWNSETSLDWHIAQYKPHKGIERLMEDLGRLYHSRDAFWAWDADPDGFQWVDCNDAQASVYSYIRRGPGSQVVVVLNLTPLPRLGYRIGAPRGGFYKEIFNSDSRFYGGSDMGNSGAVQAEERAHHGQPFSLSLTLPPLSCVVLEPEQ